MKTITVSEFKAVLLQDMHRRVKAGTLEITPSFLAVKGAGNHMLVDLINQHPYVFSYPNIVAVFESKPGSGTDSLRQRTLADLHYQRLVAADSGDLESLYVLWDRLGNIPVADGAGELAADAIEEAFLHFPVGTPREEIWHWFESKHVDFVVGDVMQGIRKAA